MVAVHALTDAEIVDTNGAGDAFAGGFLGAYVAGKDLDECVEVGHKLGSMCVQQVRSPTSSLSSYLITDDTNQVGPQYKWPKVQVL